VQGDLVVRVSGAVDREGQIPAMVEILLCLQWLASLAVISALIVHCRWEDEVVRKRTEHL